MNYLTKIRLHQVQSYGLPESLQEPQHVIHSRTRLETQDTHLNYHETQPEIIPIEPVK